MGDNIRFNDAEWLRRQGCAVSDLGAKVAAILGATYGNIYNLHGKPLNANWNNERFIIINVHSGIATFDFDHLTRLVVLCHDAAIRLEIQSSGLRMLKLMFHPRKREGDMAHRHPTIDEAVERIRASNRLQED